ncbi:MAG TPA: calcium/proton exchanger [Pyrinomonadaceae bacterium]|nr:calcium/proton exchanger [Pyrinomonadaceae bacterium]
MTLKVLLLAIPLTLLVHWFAGTHTTLVFFCSMVAMIPASLYIEKSTDSLAEYLGESTGGLVNATFGNLPEIFIGVATLRLGLHDFLKAQLVGGIIVNLLLVLGLAMFLGGLRYRLQAFSTVSARSYSSLMFLGIVALLFPSAYFAMSPDMDTQRLVMLSICVALFLLVTYVLYLIFSLRTHKDVIDTPEEAGDAQDDDKGHWSLPVAIAALLASSLCAVWLSDIMVDSVTPAASALGLSQVFMGIILMGTIGNVSGMVTAIKAARKNRMDLAFSVGVGSSVQQALFVAPALMLLSLVVGQTPMDLAFKPGMAVSTLLCVMLMGALISDGQSHWMKGIQLLAFFGILTSVILVLT